MIWPTAATQDVALKLLISSIFLSNTYVNKYSAEIGDHITRVLHKILPLSFQRAFRDSGCISFFGNFGALVAACSYCSTNLQALFDMYHVSRSISYLQYGPSHKHTIEVFTPLDGKHNNYETSALTEWSFGKPATLVFVHGGAWGCGKTWQYRLVANGIGRLLGAQNIVVVGYPTFPASTILHQRDCVSKALHFLHNDPAAQALLGKSPGHTTILCGHSSGANICALALLDNLTNRSSCALSGAATSATHHTVAAASGSSAATTVPFPNTSRSLNVDLFIGLAGVYDIKKHYLFEKNRGVHVISPMAAAAGGKSGFKECSPTIVARELQELFSEQTKLQSQQQQSQLQDKQLSTNNNRTIAAVSNQNWIRKCLPYTVLIHGTDDLVVPASSSAEFLEAINALKKGKGQHQMITLQVKITLIFYLFFLFSF